MGNYLHLAYRVSGQFLQSFDQSGVIQGLVAGVEKLLGGGGVGKTESHLTRPLQGQVQVLLMEFESEARVEGAIDHSGRRSGLFSGP